MAFIVNHSDSTVYAPGWFLANNEDCTRETRNIPASMGKSARDGKYVPMGTVYPEQGEDAEGLVYEDVDVSWGDMPGSVVTKGEVYLDRLQYLLNGSAQYYLNGSTIQALEQKGFKFIEHEPTVTRPYN